MSGSTARAGGAVIPFPGLTGGGQVSATGGAADSGRSSNGPGAKIGALAGWTDVCALAEITPSSGVAALVNGKQIAIIRVDDGEEVYAVGNFDPFSRAFVIARGIVGDRGGVPKIASPIFKQSFDLRTGQCLDDPDVRLPSYPVSVRHGRIAIYVAPDHTTGKDNEETNDAEHPT